MSGGELPSQRLRSYTFGLATAVGFLGAVSAVSFSFVYTDVQADTEYLVAHYVHRAVLYKY